MSDPNSNYTVPAAIVGSNKVELIDHGPFYFFSAAVPIHRVDCRDSVKHIYPCQVTSCTDYIEDLAEELCPPNVAIYARYKVKDQVGNEERYVQTVLPADKIRELILEMYGDTKASWGVVEVPSFAHKKDEEIDLTLFNNTIYPHQVEPDRELPEALASIVNSQGGLAGRQALLSQARTEVASLPFSKAFGKDRQVLYVGAIEDCLRSFGPARAHVKSELDKSDSEIRLKIAGAQDGKPTYDPRDTYFQWLLHRSPINEASGQQQLEIKLPEQTAGLSKADLLEIIQTIMATKAAPSAE